MSSTDENFHHSIPSGILFPKRLAAGIRAWRFFKKNQEITKQNGETPCLAVLEMEDPPFGGRDPPFFGHLSSAGRKTRIPLRDYHPRQGQKYGMLKDVESLNQQPKTIDLAWDLALLTQSIQ